MAAPILGWRAKLRLGLILVASVSTSTGSHSLMADELTLGPGVELVRGHCSACHSLQLVTAQRGDRDYWESIIRWMQQTQNLWPIPDEHEAQILDYLAQHYDETEWGRRPPLSPSLMPGSVRSSVTTP